MRQGGHIPARVRLAGLEGHVDLPRGAQQGRRAEEEAQNQLPVLLHSTKFQRAGARVTSGIMQALVHRYNCCDTVRRKVALISISHTAPPISPSFPPHTFNLLPVNRGRSTLVLHRAHLHIGCLILDPETHMRKVEHNPATTRTRQTIGRPIGEAACAQRNAGMRQWATRQRRGTQDPGGLHWPITAISYPRPSQQGRC